MEVEPFCGFGWGFLFLPGLLVYLGVFCFCPRGFVGLGRPWGLG